MAGLSDCCSHAFEKEETKTAVKVLLEVHMLQNVDNAITVIHFIAVFGWHDVCNFTGVKVPCESSNQE